MTKDQAVEILKTHNAWRRGEPPYDVFGLPDKFSAKQLGEAIDIAVSLLEKLDD